MLRLVIYQSQEGESDDTPEALYLLLSYVYVVPHPVICLTTVLPGLSHACGLKYQHRAEETPEKTYYNKFQNKPKISVIFAFRFLTIQKVIN